MSLRSTTVPHLIGGISQQAEAVRLPTQAEQQINAYPSPVDGLIKRHPTEHVAKVITGAAGATFVHEINRDSAERYIVVIRDEDVKVFETDGTVVPVHDSTNGPSFDPIFTYLDGAMSAVRAVTIADFTIVTNGEKAIQMDASLTVDDTDVGHGFVFVRQGAFDTQYTVNVKTAGDAGFNLTVTTWDGVNAGSGTNIGDTIDTQDIATALKDLIDAVGAYTSTRQGSVVRIQHAAALTEFRVSDGLGDSALVKIHKSGVPHFADLPVRMVDGYKVLIDPDPQSNDDGYYVKFIGDDTGFAFAKGTWEETVAYNIEHKFDAATMPHQLVRKQDDGSGTVTGTPNAKYFDWTIITYLDREVGDTVLAPDPSFVSPDVDTDHFITNVFFFQNRLGFLSDQNVILSETGRYFNFWPTTVRQVLDADPVDIAVGHVVVSILNHAVPFDERLILFSDRTQFVLSGEPFVSANTATISPVLEFENYPGPTPRPSGRGIFFAHKRGAFSGFREIFQVGETVNFETDDIAAHVPKYVSGTVTKMVTSTLEDVMVVLASGDTTKLYVYKYFWQGNQKLQSAWCEYTFGAGADIKNIGFIENVLFIVVQRDQGLYLEKMEISSGLVDATSTWQCRLDRRIPDTDAGVSSVYDQGEDETTFTVATYDFEDAETMQVVTRHSGGQEGGIILQIESIDTVTPGAHKIVVQGDHSATPVWIGQTYKMTYQPAEPSFGETTERGRSRVFSGRTQVKYGQLSYDESASFSVLVTPLLRDTSTSVFDSKLLGEQPVLGELNLDSGVFRFPVFSLNDQVTIVIENDTPLPSNLMTIEWEAEFVAKARRF